MVPGGDDVFDIEIPGRVLDLQPLLPFQLRVYVGHAGPVGEVGLKIAVRPVVAGVPDDPLGVVQRFLLRHLVVFELFVIVLQQAEHAFHLRPDYGVEPAARDGHRFVIGP